MTDTSNPFAGLSMSGLLQNDSKSMPQSMRQKIALAMMLKKQAYPKTFGEGLSSIGDSINEAMMMRQMGREAADVEKTNRAVEEGILGPPGGATPPPAAAGPSPVQAASIASGAPPAVPLPPDQQQSYEPGAPVRMSTPEQIADFRGQRPLPTFRPPQGTVGRAPVGDETGPPPQAMPSPMPPPGGPPPGLPPQAPQRPPVANFGQKPALAPTPPPGSPVIAQGPDPASLPMAPPDDPRRAIALAMMKQEQTGQPPVVPQSPAAPMAPDASTMAQAVPSPIRQAPPDQTAQIRKAPTYEPDYVPPARPEIPPPPTMTPRMQQIQDVIRNAAPGDREDLAARLKTPYENEVAKVKLAHEAHQAKVIDDRAYEQKRQELLATAAQRRQTYTKGSQEMVTEPPVREPTLPAGVRDPRLGTPDSPQRTGPVVPPPPPGGIQKNWAETQQKKIEADTLSLESSKPALRETIDLINQARNHVAKEYSVGAGGSIAQMTQRGQGFKAIMDQLSGQNLVAAYQKIKGTGPVGQQEGENVAKSGARITTAQSKEDFDKAMDDLELSLRGNVERNERQLKMPVTAYQRTPNDPVAPDIGEIDRTWSDGKVREYIGGDPRNKEKSWKIVR